MIETVGVISVLFTLVLLFIVLKRVLRLALRLAIIGLIVILTIGGILYYRLSYMGGDAVNRNTPSATNTPRRTTR